MAKVTIYKQRAKSLALEHALRQTQRLVRAVTVASKARVGEQAFKTGHLYDSIKSEVRVYSLKVVGKVGSRLPYAMVVHEGAKPHTIAPRLRRGMKFYWPAGVGSPPLAVGRVVCFKGKVHHPGMRGRRYLIVPLKQEAPAFGFRVVSSFGSSRFAR
jgi:hypothetical protein